MIQGNRTPGLGKQEFGANAEGAHLEQSLQSNETLSLTPEATLMAENEALSTEIKRDTEHLKEMESQLVSTSSIDGNIGETFGYFTKHVDPETAVRNLHGKSPAELSEIINNVEAGDLNAVKQHMEHPELVSENLAKPQFTDAHREEVLASIFSGLAFEDDDSGLSAQVDQKISQMRNSGIAPETEDFVTPEIEPEVIPEEPTASPEPQPEPAPAPKPETHPEPEVAPEPLKTTPEPEAAAGYRTIETSNNGPTTPPGRPRGGDDGDNEGGSNRSEKRTSVEHMGFSTYGSAVVYRRDENADFHDIQIGFVRRGDMLTIPEGFTGSYTDEETAKKKIKEIVDEKLNVKSKIDDSHGPLEHIEKTIIDPENNSTHEVESTTLLAEAPKNIWSYIFGDDAIWISIGDLVDEKKLGLLGEIDPQALPLIQKGITRLEQQFPQNN